MYFCPVFRFLTLIAYLHLNTQKQTFQNINTFLSFGIWYFTSSSGIDLSHWIKARMPGKCIVWGSNSPFSKEKRKRLNCFFQMKNGCCLFLRKMADQKLWDCSDNVPVYLKHRVETTWTDSQVSLLTSYQAGLPQISIWLVAGSPISRATRCCSENHCIAIVLELDSLILE